MFALIKNLILDIFLYESRLILIKSISLSYSFNGFKDLWRDLLSKIIYIRDP